MNSKNSKTKLARLGWIKCKNVRDFHWTTYFAWLLWIWGLPPCLKHLALLPTLKPRFRLHVLFVLQIKYGFCFEYSLWLNKIAFTHPPPSLSPYINERGDYIAVGGTAVYCPSLWDGMGRLFCADSTLETKLTFSCNTMQCHAQAHRL